MTELTEEDDKAKRNCKLGKLADAVPAGIEVIPGDDASFMAAFRLRTAQLESNLTAKFQRELHDVLGELLQDAQHHANQLKNKTVENSDVPNVIKESRRSNAKGVPHRKVFELRNSVLTDIMEISHIGTIRAIFVAVLLISVVTSFMSNSLEQKSIAYDIWLIKWNFGQFPVALLAWIGIQFSSTFLLFVPVSIWATSRTGGKLRATFFDYFMLTYYIGYFVALFTLPMRIIVRYDLPPGTALFLSCEQIRMLMKIHSFVREKAVEALNSESGNIEPEFSSFLYFLFAPTLIYRDKYPRTSRIHWHLVGRQLVGVIAGVIFIAHIFQHFSIPAFRLIQYSGLTFHTLMLATFNAIFPAMIIKVLTFYCLLHAWQNMFAEALRFGDRQFYRDWWNSTNYANFYRTWNIVVHDWLHQYVYRDLALLTGPKWRSPCQLAALLVSAVMHEYFVTLVFHCFYPIMFLLFAGCGVLMHFLHSGTGNKQWASVTVWMSLLVGYGLMLALYSMEWYARLTCPSVYVSDEDKWKDFFVSRLWTCSMHATNRSSIASTMPVVADSCTYEQQTLKQ